MLSVWGKGREKTTYKFEKSTIKALINLKLLESKSIFDTIRFFRETKAVLPYLVRSTVSWFVF